MLRFLDTQRPAETRPVYRYRQRSADLDRGSWWRTGGVDSGTPGRHWWSRGLIRESLLTSSAWPDVPRPQRARPGTGQASSPSRPHPELAVGAVGVTMGGASWQRCRTHYAAKGMHAPSNNPRATPQPRDPPPHRRRRIFPDRTSAIRPHRRRPGCTARRLDRRPALPRTRPPGPLPDRPHRHRRDHHRGGPDTRSAYCSSASTGSTRWPFVHPRPPWRAPASPRDL